MDWIDPKYATPTGKRKIRSKKGSSAGKRAGESTKKKLQSQVKAALSQPLEVWSAAFDHSISELKWPNACSIESSFLWSALMQEQAEVLVRAGMSAKKLATIVSDKSPTSAAEQADMLSDVVGLMDRNLETLAFEWIETADAYPESALGLITLAWHIPDHARRAGNDWLTQWLQSASDLLAKSKVDRRESILCQLVVHCELPLLIGLATSASKRTVLAEASKAMDFLAEFLERSEDNAAPWLAHGAIYLRAALASVLRCRVLANSLGLRKWYPSQQKALAGLLTHAARWARPDGTQLLGAGSLSPRSKAIWEALMSLSKSNQGTRAAFTLSGIGEGRRTDAKKSVRPVSLPALTNYSKTANTVVMQSDWREKSCRIATDFSDTDICLEVLGPKGEPVLAGDWTLNVQLDGQAQMRLDDWQEVCWFSDDDVDYLELETQFGQYARIQRQIVLMREARLLLLADSLLSDVEDVWTLESSLPLAAGCEFKPESKTTEGFIHNARGIECLTLPMHLPEWKRQLSQQNSNSTLLEDEGRLVSRCETRTNRAYMPVVLSIGKSKILNQYTWRPLTVADNLRIVGSNEAVAFRLQINSDQYLFYRSLAEATRRTALGMHTMSDFYIGKFDADDGEVDTIVEVEA